MTKYIWKGWIPWGRISPYIISRGVIYFIISREKIPGVSSGKILAQEEYFQCKGLGAY